jgi:hypothetical protein
MGSLTNMLLAQAAPAKPGIDESSLSGLSPEARAAILALNQQGAIPMPATGPAPSPAPMPATGPTPAPAPAQASPGILGAIGNLLMRLVPSTKSLAPQTPATPAPLTPEQLAERNRRLAGQ